MELSGSSSELESVRPESAANNERVGYEISLGDEEGIAASNEMCTDVSDERGGHRRIGRRRAETRRAKKAVTRRGKKEQTAETEKT